MPAAAIALLLGSLGANEGLKQTPYRDMLAPGHPWTVCRGITGSDVIPGKRYSLLECHDIEVRFVERMAQRMAPCLHEPLSVYEWVAWGDFTYNLGTHRWCGSTALRLLNAGQHRAACAQITRWTYTNGKDCRIAANGCGGIPARRKWERTTCERDL